MTRILPAVILSLLGAAQLTLAAEQAPPDGADAHLAAGRFGTVSVYIPEGKPKSVALFLSGDGGWQRGVINMARALRDQGAVVAGADTRRYLKSLGAAAGRP